MWTALISPLASLAGTYLNGRVEKAKEWLTSCLDWVAWTTNTTPGGFDEQRFQKGG